MDFEFEASKTKINVDKHGVTFEVAAYVFLDPYRLESYDGRNDYGEDRFVTVGCVGSSGLLLSVVYTMRGDDLYRLISARCADGNERKRYYSQVFY